MRVFRKQPVTARQRISSIVLGAVALVLAVAYLYPALSVAQYQVVGRVSIVSYIDQLGPWWTAGFGVTALGTLGALLTRRALWLVHTVGAAVSAAFAVAIWFGVFASTPHGPIVSAVMATGYGVLHSVLADSYWGGSR